jgi:hypothetical protein
VAAADGAGHRQAVAGGEHGLQVVRRLARSTEPGAEEWRALLVRLSGRQMKWGQSSTEPALLAGLWVLLAALDALERHSVEELRRLAAFVRPTSNQVDSG